MSANEIVGFEVASRSGCDKIAIHAVRFSEACGIELPSSGWGRPI